MHMYVQVEEVSSLRGAIIEESQIDFFAMDGDINCQTDLQITPLHIAVRHGNDLAMQQLLAKPTINLKVEKIIV
jgi:ankyrin repeat protein